MSSRRTVLGKHAAVTRWVAYDAEYGLARPLYVVPPSEGDTARYVATPMCARTGPEHTERGVGSLADADAPGGLPTRPLRDCPVGGETWIGQSRRRLWQRL